MASLSTSRVLAASGVILAAVALGAPGCGGRDQLGFGPGSEGGFGEGGFGQGGFGEGGAGEGGFAEGGFGGFEPSGGFGGMPTTTVVVSSGPGVVTSVGPTTVTTTATSSNVSSSVSSSVSTSVSSSVSTSVSTSSVSTSVSTSNTVTTTTSTGMGGAPPITVVGVGGAPVTTIATGVGGGNPLDCITCITGQCPQALACVQNPSCLNGLVCTFSQCIGSGPPNFPCVLNCFNGDFMAAFQALQAGVCIFNNCGQVCNGAFP